MNTHRRGTTFSLYGTLSFTDSGTAVTNLTGYTGTARLLTPGTYRTIATLTFAWTDATTAAASITTLTTAGWPLGDALLDLRLTTPTGETVAADYATIRIIP
jgi:hypothetical protein